MPPSLLYLSLLAENHCVWHIHFYRPAAFFIISKVKGILNILQLTVRNFAKLWPSTSNFMLMIPDLKDAIAYIRTDRYLYSLSLLFPASSLQLSLCLPAPSFIQL